MRTALTLLVVLLPGAAGAASFSHPGSMLISGHFAYQSSDFETSSYSLDESQVAFGPALSVFLWKHIALRVSPGFTIRKQSWTESGVKRSQSLDLVSLALGPSVYLPISQAAFFTAGAHAGLHLGSLASGDSMVSKVEGDGYSLGVETGLAFLVNGTGLVELLAAWDQRHTTFGGDGHFYAWDENESGISIGFRLGIAL